MRFDSVAMTVAPTTDPSGRKCWSMPTLRPMMTAFVIAGAALGPLASVVVVSSVTSLSVLLELDLDIDAGRKVELHEGVDRLLRWIVDIDEALVRPDLELLTRVLVDERAADHGELLDARGQRHGPRHRRSRPLRGLDDLRGGLVDQLVVVGLEPDPDALFCHLCLAHSRIFVTTPAPTVLPLARAGQRRPSSSAMAVPKVTVSCTLSPGMTISVPAGSSAVPVTSVVRM